MGQPAPLGAQLPLATFGSLADVRRAVDHLAARGFPTAGLQIVGDDLCVVQHVVGRWRAWLLIASGAAGGAGVGTGIGSLLTLTTPDGVDAGAFLIWAALWGAVLGLALGAFGYAASGGGQCLYSRCRLAPRRFEIRTHADVADEAWLLLAGSAGPGRPSDR